MLRQNLTSNLAEYDDPWSMPEVTDPNAPQLVLVVDDSRMQRKILTMSLRKWGYDVLEAESGQEGLELCKSHDISMVISDWMMPGMNGPEFCAAFRRMKKDAYGYFVLLTSKGESREIAEGLDSGADDFLTKPVSFGELRARLRAGERIVRMHAQLIHKNQLVNGSLTTVRNLYESIERDLIEARKLLHSLLPKADVSMGHSRASMMLRPSWHVGGDLVGQFRINSKTVALFSLDVSGHGVTSALITARLAGFFSGSAATQELTMTKDNAGNFIARDPAEIAEDLNRFMLDELETDNYFTLVLAIVDLETGRVSAVQAGHPHPIVIPQTGQPSLKGEGGMPIGLLPNAGFESFAFDLTPGDRLVLYSDGITEAENEKAGFLDEDGLIEWLQNSRAQTPPAALEDLQSSLENFTGQTEFADDISALIFDFKADC